MTRFAFVTWDGGGNVSPAVGIAQGLAARGHDVVFIGYEVQRTRFEGRQLPFVALRRTGGFDIYAASDPGQRIAGLMANVWASPEHLDDIPDALAATSSDVLVVDFSMQGALASAIRSAAPMAVLAHSAIAGLVPPPESPMGAARLSATNRLREAARLPQLARLTEAWTGYTTLVTTIPALDPAAETADGSVHYLGPVFEALPDDAWESPWAAGDDRPLVLVSFSTTGLWDQSGRIRTRSRDSPASPFESWYRPRRPWTSGRSRTTRRSVRSCRISGCSMARRSPSPMLAMERSPRHSPMGCPSSLCQIRRRISRFLRRESTSSARAWRWTASRDRRRSVMPSEKS